MEEYLDSICNNIKCVTFRKTIRRELQTHMEEAFETELSNGLNQIDAELKVISEMGDPDVIGKQLIRKYPYILLCSYHFQSFVYLLFLLWLN